MPATGICSMMNGVATKLVHQHDDFISLWTEWEHKMNEWAKNGMGQCYQWDEGDFGPKGLQNGANQGVIF
uniref:SCP domain-containing protein n=1 Tax=Panagrellus redivivus TaxID=6233 RepID=A0A7E4VNN8_PANRE